jgi:hypothetical protein
MWNTDLNAAPKGVDVLVAVWTVSRTSTHVMLGMQLFEPCERDPEDTDDDADGGTWGELDGEQGIWYWHLSDGQGHTDKKEIAAWQPEPAPYTPSEG